MPAGHMPAGPMPAGPMPAGHMTQAFRHWLDPVGWVKYRLLGGWREVEDKNLPAKRDPEGAGPRHRSVPYYATPE